MKFTKTYIGALFYHQLYCLTSCEAVQNSNHQQRGTAVGVASGAVIGGILEIM
jgi:hypothetical protein